jgi:hypothetical protein
MVMVVMMMMMIVVDAITPPVPIAMATVVP